MENLETMLEECNYEYCKDESDNCWSTYVNGFRVKITQPEQTSLRACIETGIHVHEKTIINMKALTNYLDAWEILTGSFSFSEENEVIFTVEWKISETNYIDQMVLKAANIAEHNFERLRLVANSVTPREALRKA